MYCSNCGNQLPDGASFCPGCGTPLGEPKKETKTTASFDRASASIIVNKKSEGLAIILSLIITGLGEMYVGQVGKGIMLLIVQVLLWVLTMMFLFPFIIAIAVWIYSMYDAYTLAKYYNNYLLENDGNTPW